MDLWVHSDSCASLSHYILRLGVFQLERAKSLGPSQSAGSLSGLLITNASNVVRMFCFLVPVAEKLFSENTIGVLTLYLKTIW